MNSGLLVEYKNLIDQKIPVNNDWDEELNNISHVRHLIHEDIDSVDRDMLRGLDKKWQSHILSTKSDDFGFSYPREDTPRSYWWAWIDKINELNPEDLSTL